MGRGQPALDSLPLLPWQKEMFWRPKNCTESSHSHILKKSQRKRFRLGSVNIPWCFQLHTSSLLLAAAMRAAPVLLPPVLTNSGTGRMPDLKEVTFLWHSDKVSLYAQRTILHLFHLLSKSQINPWRQSIFQFTAHQTFPRTKQYFFSDMELICTEYLIYHFLNITSLFCMKKVYPPPWLLFWKCFSMQWPLLLQQ